MGQSEPLRVEFRHTFADTGAEVSVDLSLPASGITGVFGPSGSGKTTLLRVIAGLTRVPDARLQLAATWQDASIFVPTHERRIGYIFQEPSLFPHLDVKGNLNYASQRATVPFGDSDRIIELLGLTKLLARPVHSLSGGEQQRVAIARALFSTPQLLLLDEPLASLDQKRKREILPYLLELKAELDIPMIYVSHAAEELASLADWLVVMDHGAVQASGPIGETFHHIAEAAHGESDLAVLIDANVESEEQQWGLLSASFLGGTLLVRESPTRGQLQQLRLRVQARDVSISLEQPGPSSILNCLPAVIDEIEIKEGIDGSMVLVTAWVGETRFLANITRKSLEVLDLKPGLAVFLQLKSVAILN